MIPRWTNTRRFVFGELLQRTCCPLTPTLSPIDGADGGEGVEAFALRSNVLQHVVLHLDLSVEDCWRGIVPRSAGVISKNCLIVTFGCSISARGPAGGIDYALCDIPPSSVSL